MPPKKDAYISDRAIAEQTITNAEHVRAVAADAVVAPIPSAFSLDGVTYWTAEDAKKLADRASARRPAMSVRQVR